MVLPPLEEKRRGFHLGIRGRLFGLLLVVFVPILVFLAIEHLDRFERRKQDAFASNLELARALSAGIEGLILDILRQEMSIGTAIDSGELSSGNIDKLIRRSLDSYPALHDLFHSDARGIIVQSANPVVKDMNVFLSPSFQALIGGADWHVSDIFPDPLSGKTLFNVSRAMRSESGGLNGAVGAVVDVDLMGPLFDPGRVGERAVAVYDRAGRLVFSGPGQKLTWADRNVLSRRPEVLTALDGREVTTSRKDAGQGEEWVVAIVPIPSLKWAVESRVPRDEILAPIEAGLIGSATVTLCVIGASLLLALLVARSITVPLKRLRNGIAIQATDATGARVDEGGPKELADLAGAFNAMAEEIRRRESSLDTERRFMARILDSIPVMVTCLDRDLVVRQCNRAGAGVLGRAVEEVVGKRLDEILPRRSYPDLWEHMGTVLDTGRTQTAFTLAFEKPHEPGREYFFLVSLLPDRNEEGEVTGVFVEGLDITETERLHREIDAQRNLLLAVIQNTPAGVVLLDAESLRVKWNNGYYRSFLDPPHRDGDLQGLRIQDFVPGAEEAGLVEIFEGVARTGESHVNPEYEHTGFSRGVTYWRWTLNPVRDDQGRVTDLVLVALEVTEQVIFRKRVEDAARAAEEGRVTLLALMEHVPEGITIADGPDAHIRMVSRHGLELMGQSEGEILGLPAGDHVARLGIHHTDGSTPARMEEMPLIRATLRGEVVDDEEWVLRRPDGSRITILCNAGPIRDSEGKVTGGVVAWRDISERKAAEERLRRREEEYRALIENAPDPIVRYDRNLARIYVNTSARDLFGRGAGAWVDTTVAEGVLVEESVSPLKEALRQVFESGERRMVEVTLVTEMKEQVHLVHLAPEFSKSGRVETVIGMGRDITKLKRLEKELRLAKEDLEVRVRERTLDLARANAALQERARELGMRNRELEDMTFIASHDLQEPLRKIQTFASRLKNSHAGVLGTDGVDALDRVEYSATRMRDLIQDVLEYSMVVSRGRPFTRVDLGELLGRLVEGFDGRLRDSGGTVEAHGVPVALSGDPQQLHRLFYALIDNALKFRRQGVPPRVKITRGARDLAPEAEEGLPPSRAVEIRVEDNGIGFDEKYLGLIFTPLEQLHGRGVYGGTGMGLAIGRRIVERHGGSITATSRPGEGSTFIVVLPLQSAEPSPVRDPLCLDPEV